MINYWDAARGCYNDCTEPVSGHTHSQHPLAVGLYFDLLEGPRKQQALDALINNHDLIKANSIFSIM